MGKHGGKGGKGRVGKFVGLAAGLAFGLGGGAWGFLKGVSAFSRVMYGLSLGMSIGGLFDKQPKQSTPESTFDSKNNTVTSEGTVPIVYGQTKVGGLQTFHKMDVNGKRLDKDVVLCEGKINNIFGITANGYLTSVQRQNETKQTKIPVFGIRNNKYPDAKVSIESGRADRHGYTHHNVENSQQSIYQGDIDYSSFNKFKYLKLTANGNTVYIFLTDDNTTIDLQYSLACNTFGKIYQILLGDTYLSDLQTDGWELVNPVICQNSPSSLEAFGETSCYKRDVFCQTNGNQDGSNCTVYTYLGGKDQDAPSQYLTTGGYPNMAYVHADLRYSDKMGAGNPTVTAIVQGMIVYDWRDKQYKYSKNPVVCLYDYLTNKVYGAGRYVTSDILDMESFTDVANYCDEEITYNDPYGVTKTEPRYQLDICLNETKTHQENIQSILNSFLGFIVFSNNKIKLRCERLEQPVYAFNDDNIVEESLSYKSASIDQSPNKFNLTYVEPALDYTAVKLIVEDATNQLPPPIGIGRPVEQDIDFKGVRRQTQCLRLGKIARDIIRLCPITATFKTGLMASHLEAGDIITISKTYIDEDGVKQELFTNQQARITEIKEEDGTFEITARQYNPSIYDDTFGSTLKVFGPSGNNTPIKLTPASVKPVENIQFNQIYRGKVDGLPTYDIVLSFDEPDDIEFRSASVYIQTVHNNITSEWKNYGTSNGITTVIGLKRGDTINARIIPNDSKSIEHEESMSAPSYTVVSKFGTPAMPLNLALKITDEARVSWDIIKNTDIDHYEISTDESFSSGVVVSLDNEAPVTLTSRRGTIYVRGVNIDNVAGPSNQIGFNWATPDAPRLNYIKSQSGAFQVVVQDIPKTNPPILKTVFRVNDKDFRTDSNVFTYVDDPGTYTVLYAYEDYFGLGTFGGGQSAVIKQNIDQDLINRATAAIQSVEQMQANIDTLNTRIQNAVTEQIQNSIGGTKLEITKAADAMKQQITDAQHQMESTITQTANALDTKIKDLDTQVQSRVTQLAGTIESSIKSLSGDEILSRINQSSGGTQIDGKLLHVTSDSVFDKGVVAKNIEAGTITMDKMQGGTINLSNFAIGGESLSLCNTGMFVTTENGDLISFDKRGISWVDANGVKRGTLRKMMYGTGYHGDIIHHNFDKECVIFIEPKSITSASYNDITKIDYSPVVFDNKSFKLQATIEFNAQPDSTYILDEPALAILTVNDGNRWVIPGIANISRYSKLYQCPSDGDYTFIFNLQDFFSEKRKGGIYIRDNYDTGIIPISIDIIIDGRIVATLKPQHNNKPIQIQLHQTKGPHKLSYRINIDKSYNHWSFENNILRVPLNPQISVTIPETSSRLHLIDPLNFLVVEQTKEDYYQQEQPLPTSTQFTGRGTYTFTATGTRAKIIMAGAVASTRNTDTASLFVGDNVNLVANNAGVSRKEDSQIHILQPSHKYHEIDDVAAESMMYGIQGDYNENTDNLLFISQIYQKGLITGFDWEEFQFNYVTNPKTPIFNVATRFGNADIGSPVKINFAGIPSFNPKVSSDNPGGYAREFTRDWSLSVNYPAIMTQEVTLVPGQTYTVTVGACPDMRDGQTIVYPSGNENITLKCINQSVFDGFVSIQEYK